MPTSKREPSYEVSAKLEGSDIQIGAVEVKDASTENRLRVDTSGRAYISIQEDGVGLAKETTLQETNTKLVGIDNKLYDSSESKTLTDITKEIRDGVAKDSTLQQTNNMLGSIDNKIYDSVESKSIATLVKELRDLVSKEETLNEILSKLDLSLTSLRDALLTNLKQNLFKFFVSTDPLASGDFVESNPYTTVGYSKIVGSVFSDVSGTLYVLQSGDGANWDVVEEFSVEANKGLGFVVEVVAEWVKIKYVNGGSDQSVFRLHAYLRRY